MLVFGSFKKLKGHPKAGKKWLCELGAQDY